ncbi:MAG: ABC transporter permease [Candidatus Latescibacteria bacterium]|nr:ABC transporter permease [Candidatus Latescibacterota bacterium]
MSYELFIAQRYLRSKRRTRFVSIITYISVGGVLVGVAALVIVLSLFNGFESEVRERIIGERAHVHVLSIHNKPITHYNALIARLAQVDHVVAATPFVLSKAMLSVLPDGSSDGVVVIGIDPVRERRVTEITKHVVFGSFDLDVRPRPGDQPGETSPGLLIGRGLADGLGVVLGQKVALANLQGMSIGTSLVPTVKVFRVTGIFETGLYEYDSSFTYISLPDAQRLFKLEDGVTGIAVRVDDRNRARLIADEIETALQHAQENANAAGVDPAFEDTYYTVDWMQQHKTLFRWMTIEKWLSFAVLNLIILVAAFNIVSTLIMVVLEKTKDIGILKSMGATSKSVMKIFICQGSVVGVVGTVLGCLVGFAACWAQETFQFIALPPDIYFINALPIRMEVVDFVSVAVGSMAICTLATIYPAWKAAQLAPVEAIRYE